jgi:cell division protein FtsQ
VAARRAEGQRRLRVLVAAAAVLLVAVVAWAVTASPLLAVHRVVVRGATHTSATALGAAAGIHRGDAMIWLHPGDAAGALRALPWVRTAKVSRSWPTTVRITVTERTPVAWADGPAGHVLVDRTGRVLEGVVTVPAGLPQLAGQARVGKPGTSLALSAAAQVAARLGALRATTRSVAVSKGGVTVTLVNGTEVRMGDAAEADAKARAAVAVLASLGTSPVHYVDVSVPTNPVAG